MTTSPGWPLLTLKQIWERAKQRRTEEKQQRALNNDLYNAIAGHDLDGVKVALESGAKAGAGARLCLFKGNADIMQALIYAGVSPNQSFAFGDGIGPSEEKSALYLAIENGKEDIALLLANHPDTQISNSGLTSTTDFSGVSRRTYFPTPIEIAREKGMNSVVEALATRMANELRQEVQHLRSHKPAAQKPS